MPSSHRPTKTTAITLKAANRRVAQPPTPDLSGDEGYSALEDLDESDEDDDENVWAAEEEHLITDLETGHKIRSPRPLFYNEDEQEDGDDEDEGAEDEDEDEDDEEADEDLAGHNDEDDDDADSDNKSWNGFPTDATEPEGDLTELNELFPAAVHTERHVRFNVPDSDSDSTDTDDDHADMFPDIFVDQATLDPAIRREIDRDPEESGTHESFWDFQSGFEYSSADSDMDMFLPSAAVSTAAPSDDEATPIATPAGAHAMGGLASELTSPTQASGFPVDFDGYECEFLPPSTMRSNCVSNNPRPSVRSMSFVWMLKC